MAKRFTDTGKWNKPFLRGMKAPYKLLWIYILDECNHAGIWEIDFEVAQIKIGEKLNKETAHQYFNGQILEFDNKWFIYNFIEFQYGELNPVNRAHNSVIQLLTKYGIDWKIKPLTSPLQGCKDKEKDKDMELVKDKEEANFYRKINHLKLTFEEFDKLILEGWSKSQIDETLDSIENYKKNVNYTSLYLTTSKWLKKDQSKQSKPQATLTAYQEARKNMGL